MTSMTRQTYNSPHDDLSRATAELLEGDYLISENRGVRAIQLTQLVILMNSVQKLGWHTHTGDWDWSLEVTLRDGTEYGTDDERDVYGDNFYLRNGESTIDLNNHWTACVDYESLTHFVIEYTLNDAIPTIAIPVEDLKTIRIYSE